MAYSIVRYAPVNRYMRPASLWLSASALFVSPAFSADVFIQPSGYVQAELNSNLDLTPGLQQGQVAVPATATQPAIPGSTSQPSTQGYLADIASIIGIATPNSTTTIRPRLDYRNYPTDSGDNRVEEYLDFGSYYKDQRNTIGIAGSLDHRDELNAELTPATYEDGAANSSTAPQTGQVIKSATRDSSYISPSYSYNITPRIAAGVAGLYQKINYSPNDEGRYEDFTYYQGKAYLVWTVTQKSDLTFGAYGNKYSATRFDSTANAAGASVEFNTSWSPLLTTQASFLFQRANINNETPPVFDGSVNAWGGSLAVNYKTATQQIRADLTRMITPSGGGSVYINNQLHVEYDRSITKRLSLTTAALALRNYALVNTFVGNGRDYTRALVEMKWMITPTWFVQGGYQYTWEKYQTYTTLTPAMTLMTNNIDGAANNRIYIRFGYKGLDRQW